MVVAGPAEEEGGEVVSPGTRIWLASSYLECATNPEFKGMTVADVVAIFSDPKRKAVKP